MCGYICWFICLVVFELACKVVGVYVSVFDLRVFWSARRANYLDHRSFWLTQRLPHRPQPPWGWWISLFLEENQQPVINNSFVFLMSENTQHKICLLYCTVLCCLTIYLLAVRKRHLLYKSEVFGIFATIRLLPIYVSGNIMKRFPNVLFHS